MNFKFKCLASEKLIPCTIMCELMFCNILFDVLLIVHFLLETVFTNCSYTSIEKALPLMKRLVDCCVRCAYIRLICSNEWGVIGFIQVFLYITAVLDVIYRKTV